MGENIVYRQSTQLHNIWNKENAEIISVRNIEIIRSEKLWESQLSRMQLIKYKLKMKIASVTAQKYELTGVYFKYILTKYTKCQKNLDFFTKNML